MPQRRPLPSQTFDEVVVLDSPTHPMPSSDTPPFTAAPSEVIELDMSPTPPIDEYGPRKKRRRDQSSSTPPSISPVIDLDAEDSPQPHQPPPPSVPTNLRITPPNPPTIVSPLQATARRNSFMSDEIVVTAAIGPRITAQAHQSDDIPLDVSPQPPSIEFLGSSMELMEAATPQLSRGRRSMPRLSSQQGPSRSSSIEPITTAHGRSVPMRTLPAYAVSDTSAVRTAASVVRAPSPFYAQPFSSAIPSQSLATHPPPQLDTLRSARDASGMAMFPSLPLRVTTADVASLYATTASAEASISNSRTPGVVTDNQNPAGSAMAGSRRRLRSDSEVDAIDANAAPTGVTIGDERYPNVENFLSGLPVSRTQARRMFRSVQELRRTNERNARIHTPTPPVADAETASFRTSAESRIASATRVLLSSQSAAGQSIPLRLQRISGAESRPPAQGSGEAAGTPDTPRNAPTPELLHQVTLDTFSQMYNSLEGRMSTRARVMHRSIGSRATGRGGGGNGSSVETSSAAGPSAHNVLHPVRAVRAPRRNGEGATPGGSRRRHGNLPAHVRHVVYRHGGGTAAIHLGLHPSFGGMTAMGVGMDGQLDYDQLVRLDEQLLREKNRADKEQIEALPVEKAGQEDKEIRCCVCMNDVAVGEELRVLPCKHKYHKECIDQWLTYNGCCPVDKKRIGPPRTRRRCPMHRRRQFNDTSQG